MHDALLALCERFLRSGTLPEHGGTPATVIVTMRYEDLAGRCGYAESTTGVRIPVTGPAVRPVRQPRRCALAIDNRWCALRDGERTAKPSAPRVLLGPHVGDKCEHICQSMPPSIAAYIGGTALACIRNRSASVVPLSKCIFGFCATDTKRPTRS